MVAVNLQDVLSAASLLGVGSKNGPGGGMSLDGASFAVDIPKLGPSRVHGSSLRLDVDNLEISASKGVLKYTANAIEYIRNSMRWINTLDESSVNLNHNANPVIQLLSLDDPPSYLLRMVRDTHHSLFLKVNSLSCASLSPSLSQFYLLIQVGDGQFNDIKLNYGDSVRAFNNYCIAGTYGTEL